MSLANILSFFSNFTHSVVASSEIVLPREWQLGLVDAASTTKAEIHDFHNMLLVIITAITVFVLGLMIYTVIRFRKSANPVPSKTTHNTALEVIWTAIPVLILVIIVIPSMRVLYSQNQTVDAEMTIKATGYQWYWGYEYPDHDGIAFMSYMVPDDKLKPGQPRLLQTDTEVVVPVNTKIRVLVTAADVLHSWAMPAFGVKKDAVPGRLNETWFMATRTGTFYGQCSEICGIGHGFMPITVRVVTQEEFDEWVKWAKQEYAQSPLTPANDNMQLAQIQ